MKVISLFLLTIALTYSCSQSPIKKERPFYGDRPYYFNYDNFDPSTVAAPPKEGSAQDKKDLLIVEKYQKERTAQDCHRAVHEKIPDYQHFFSDIGPFPKNVPEEVDEFFWKIKSDVGRTVSKVKKLYNRERPFKRDPKRFQPCEEEKFGKSYPSGHAAIARTMALILETIDPKTAQKYEERANQAALNRVIGGVHHPSDIETGKAVALMVFKEMTKNEEFQKDLYNLRSYMK
ncbi:MAG: phosphatase PAP2 family protein [Oligoflexia bacterium]|nr:phosphatase PAP2 family protein [Oligoflexia bacterium]